MNSSKQKLKRVRPLFGTFVEIVLEGPVSSSQLSTWMTDAFHRFEELEQLWSIYRPASDLSRLNAFPAKTWVTVHPLTVRLFRAANHLWKESDGIFDIRCLPPWSPGKESEPPTRIRGQWARRQGTGRLDAGGIAKGFAVDCVVLELQRQSRGYDIDGIVNAGGDLRRFGKRWPPLALATSAPRTPKNARRLSPAIHTDRTRQGLRHKAAAVSVMAKECLWADALTKVALLAPTPVIRRCLQSHHANAMTFSSQGRWTEIK